MGVFDRLFGRKKDEHTLNRMRDEDKAEEQKILPGAVTRKDLGICEHFHPQQPDFVLQREFTEDQMLMLRKGFRTTVTGEWSWFMEGDNLYLCRNQPDAMVYYYLRLSMSSHDHAVSVIRRKKMSMEAEKDDLIRWFDTRIGKEKHADLNIKNEPPRYDVREMVLNQGLTKEQVASIQAEKGVHVMKDGWTWFVSNEGRVMNILEKPHGHCVYRIEFAFYGDSHKVFVSHLEDQWETIDIKEELERLVRLLNEWFPSNESDEPEKEEEMDSPMDVESLRRAGEELEQQEKYEEAFLKYKKAAEMDDTQSMICIARMYLFGKFRPVDSSNLAELLQQGTPIFPWSLRSEKQPDFKSGLAWLMKAADLGNGLACKTCGNMLCSGMGCKADVEKGISYLEKAVAYGQTSARKYICLYRPDGKELTDQEYETCLIEFATAAEAADDRAYELYATLKSGTQKQLARLGHTLIAAQNVHRGGYEAFKYSLTPSGIPLLPVASKRRSWRTFLRFNLDAWAEETPLIAVCADILNVREPSWLLSDLYHARIVGRAKYRSPAFGWLGEEKKAVLIRLGEKDALSGEKWKEVKEVAQSFALVEEEYQGESIAFMVENGEKEYSVEVAGITDDQVEVLWRYTIGASNSVDTYFEPQLISMEMDE